MAREHTERELVLAEWFLLYEDTDELDADAQARAEVDDIRTELRQKYLAMLTPVPISRCPFTGEILSYPVDVEGLDGPFWDVRNPTRLAPPEKPETFVGLAGAVQLTGDPADIPYFPFLARPGPEVPYVLPEPLSVDGVVAVVSTISVGPHRAFPVAYFAEPGTDPEKVPTVDEWGSDRAWRRDRLRGWVWDSSNVDEDDFDYDLVPWMEQDKLRWIAPGDASLAIKTGVAGCPYLDQPGRREVTRIEDLEVWWPSEAPSRD